MRGNYLKNNLDKVQEEVGPILGVAVDDDHIQNYSQSQDERDGQNEKNQTVHHILTILQFLFSYTGKHKS